MRLINTNRLIGSNNSDMTRKSKRLIFIWSLILVTGLLVIWNLNRHWKIQEEKDRIAQDLASRACIQGDSCMVANDLRLASKFYTSSFSRNPTDSIVARLITCEQRQGNTAEALKWLDELEKQSRKSDFTALRRSNIILQSGDSTRALQLLDSILARPIRLKKSRFVQSLLDAWLHSNKDYTKATNYYCYYCDYLGKLMVLNSRLSISSKEDVFRQGAVLFHLAEDQVDDYEIMNEYLEMLRENSTVFWKILRKGWMSWGKNDLDLHILYSTGFSNYDYHNLIDLVSSIKWRIFNNLIIQKHINQGHTEAVDYAQQITQSNSCNTDARYNFHKFIYGIYLGASNNDLFPSTLTVNDLDSILYQSLDTLQRIQPAYLTIGQRFMLSLGDKDKFHMTGDKFIGPAIILQCNDWNWRNDSLTFPQYVERHKKDLKTIKYLNDNFKASESSTEGQKFGLMISFIPSNTYEMNLLQAEYERQISPR